MFLNFNAFLKEIHSILCSTPNQLCVNPSDLQGVQTKVKQYTYTNAFELYTVFCVFKCSTPNQLNPSDLQGVQTKVKQYTYTNAFELYTVFCVFKCSTPNQLNPSDLQGVHTKVQTAYTHKPTICNTSTLQ